MPYATSRRATTASMTPEESIVLAALNHLCFEPEFNAADDWAPIKDLHAQYLHYVLEHDVPPNLVLPVRGFGVALRRVFDLHPGRKRQKRWNGRLTWGYCHVSGPGTIKAGSQPGRKANAPRI